MPRIEIAIQTALERAADDLAKKYKLIKKSSDSTTFRTNTINIITYSSEKNDNVIQVFSMNLSHLLSLEIDGNYIEFSYKAKELTYKISSNRIDFFDFDKELKILEFTKNKINKYYKEEVEKL